MDYKQILNTNFGMVVQRLLGKNKFQNILIIKPNDIKISDWRNIAYHHTYDILNSRIICKYGKKGSQFSISIDELHGYAARIIKACNVIDIARRIFIFDNKMIFEQHLNEDSIHVHDRDVMKIGQLKTSMLSQGFKLITCQVNMNFTDAHVHDLKRTDKLTDDEKLKREIHCSQFLYNIWIKFKTEIVKITYYDSSGNSLYEYSVNGVICNDIANNKLELLIILRRPIIRYSSHIKYLKKSWQLLKNMRVTLPGETGGWFTCLPSLIIDLNKAKQWYTNILNTPPIFDTSFAVIFKIGECTLTLSKANAPKPEAVKQ